VVFREIKDVVKQEVLARNEELEKIEFELKDDESNFMLGFLCADPGSNYRITNFPSTIIPSGYQ
jgi:hypothetical protein